MSPVESLLQKLFAKPELLWKLLLFAWAGFVILGPYQVEFSLQGRLLLFVIGLMVWFAAQYYWTRYNLTRPKRFDKELVRNLRKAASVICYDVEHENADVANVRAHVTMYRGAINPLAGNADIVGVAEALRTAAYAYVQELGKRQHDDDIFPDRAPVMVAYDKLQEFTSWAAHAN